MGLHLLDYFGNQIQPIPFAAGDAAILTDIDFTQYTSAAEFVAANPGWTVGNSANSVFDADGFGGAHATLPAYLYTTTYDGAAALASAGEGTITVWVDRECLASDETEANYAATFIQSVGTPGATRNLFKTQNAAGSYSFRLRHVSNNTIGIESYIASVLTAWNGGYLNSQVPYGLTSSVPVSLTWRGNLAWVLVDGAPFCYATLTGKYATDANSFLYLILAATDTAGTHGLFTNADYRMQRLQVCNQAAFPVFTGTRDAFFGDSFMRAASACTNASVIDIKHSSDVADKYFGGTSVGGSVPARQTAAQEYSRLCVANGLGVPWGIYGYNTTQNGAYWASNGGNVNSLAYAAAPAVVALNPERIHCAGSINDVTNHSQTVAQTYADTLAILDTFIDGCSNLREIHFYEQFPGLRGSTSTNTAAYHTRSADLRAAMAQVDGYRGVVFYHPTRHLWDESFTSATNPEFTVGSAPTNTKTANGDIHPSTLGHLKIGKIMFDAEYPYLSVPPML